MTITTRSIPDIDITETVELVYREGRYEKRWTAARYCLGIVGYANACKNEWTVAARSIADLTDPMTAARDVILKDANHCRVESVYLFDRKIGRFTIAA